MNSKKSNQKIIDALQDFRPIHEETDEERDERLKIEKEILEKVTKVPPLVFPRKVAGIFCAAVWLISLLGMAFGFASIGVMLPFLLLALGIYGGLNIPVFWWKEKIVDTIICFIATVVCIVIAVAMLTVGTAMV